MGVRASVLTIVNQALQELGLPQVETTLSVFDDQTGFQALGLVNALGTQLVKVHDWQFLEKSVEFTGDGVATEFDMPDDFGRIVNQTQWSSTNRRPMVGPVSPQGWSWVKYGIVSVGVYYRYRILDGKFTVFPVPALGEKINFFYISRNWVFDPTIVLPLSQYKDKLTKDTDEPVFDSFLMIAGAKFKLWAAKGMESSELGREFEYMVQAEKGQTQGAAVIQLSGSGAGYLIGGQNIPDGSWNV